MPISCESQYCLDSAVDLCQISPDTAAFYYRSETDVDGIIEQINGAGFIDRFADTMRDNYLEIYPEIHSLERGILCLTGVLGLKHQIQEVALNTSERLLEGKTSSDALYAKHGFERFIQNTRALLDRAEQDLFRASIRDLIDYETERRYLQNIHRRTRISDVRSDLVDTKATKAMKKITHQIQKTGKKVLKKSVRTMSRLVGDQTARMFIGGESITVSGKDFSFRFSKTDYSLILHSGSPDGRAHIQYKLDLLDQNGDYLATGCVYLKDTPVIDQVTGLMLHIRAGNEHEIVKTTNWFQTSELFLTNSVLQEIRTIKQSISPSVPAITLPTMNDDDTYPENFLSRLAIPGLVDPRVNDARERYCIKRDQKIPEAHEIIRSELGCSENLFRFLVDPPISLDELQMIDCSPEFRTLLIEQIHRRD